MVTSPGERVEGETLTFPKRAASGQKLPCALTVVARAARAETEKKLKSIVG
jgi:hypothetical protein